MIKKYKCQIFFYLSRGDEISTLYYIYIILYIYEGKIGMMVMIRRQVGMTDGTMTDYW